LQRTLRAWHERKTAAFTAVESVAAITRKAPAISRGENDFLRQTSFPCRAWERIELPASGLMTVTCAPQLSRPLILAAATLPAPTTTQRRRLSLIMAGNSAVSGIVLETMVTHPQSIIVEPLTAEGIKSRASRPCRPDWPSKTRDCDADHSQNRLISSNLIEIIAMVFQDPRPRIPPANGDK